MINSKLKRKVLRQILSVVLCLTMCFSLMPMTAFAAVTEKAPDVYEADDMISGADAPYVGKSLVCDFESWVIYDDTLTEKYLEGGSKFVWLFSPKDSMEEIEISDSVFDEKGYIKLQLKPEWYGGTVRLKCTFSDGAVLYSTPIEVAVEPGHGPSTNIAYDDDYHYFTCIDSSCTNEEHKFEISYHVFELLSDLEGHWLNCTECPYTQEEYKVEHFEYPEDADGVCDTCGEAMFVFKPCGPNAAWAYDPEGKTLTIAGDSGLYCPVDDDFSTLYQTLDWDTCTIEEGVTMISDYFFASPDSAPVKSIHVAASVESIGDSAFYGTPVEYVYFNTASKLKEIKRNAFDSCESLTEIYLPPGLKTIGKEAFLECKNLKTVHLPSTVETLDPSAFKGTGLEKVYFDGTRADWTKLVSRLDAENELCKAEVIYTNITALTDVEIYLYDFPTIGETPSNDGYADGRYYSGYDRVVDCSIEWQVGDEGIFTSEPTFATIILTLEDGYTIDDSTNIDFDMMDKDYGYKVIGTPDGKTQVEFRSVVVKPVAYAFTIATLSSDKMMDGAKYVVAEDEYHFAKLVRYDFATTDYLTFDSEKGKINVVGTVKLYGPYNGIIVTAGNVMLSGAEGSELIIEGIGNSPLSISSGSFILDGAVDLKLTSSASQTVSNNSGSSDARLLSTDNYSGDVVIEHTGLAPAIQMNDVYIKTSGDVVFKTDAEKNSAPTVSGYGTIHIEANSFSCSNYISTMYLEVITKEDVTLGAEKYSNSMHSAYIDAKNINVNTSGNLAFNVYGSNDAKLTLVASNDINLDVKNSGGAPAIYVSGTATVVCKNLNYTLEKMGSAFIATDKVDIVAEDTVTFNYENNGFLFQANADIKGSKIILNETGDHKPLYPAGGFTVKFDGDLIYDAVHNYVQSGPSLHTCTICAQYESHDFTEGEANGDGTHTVTCKVCHKIQDGHDKDACSGGTATCKAKAKCEVCGAEYGKLKAHTYGLAWKSDSTNHWHACTVCGAKKDRAAHTLKTTTTKKATMSAAGTRTTKCTICEKVTKTTNVYAVKTIKLSATAYTYDGKVKKPSVTVKNSAGTTLKKDTDYTVSYASGRKLVGKYKVTIKGKGEYDFTKSLYFKINPVKTSITCLTKGTKSFTVKWAKKTTQTTGYEIQYSTSSTFKTGTATKKVIVKSNKTTSKTIKSLKAKKKYYVRVRTYKTVGGTKYYSVWSSKNAVTTK